MDTVVDHGSLERSGQYQEAIKCYNRGLEANSTTEELYQNLISCYHKAGLRGEAVSTYRRCCTNLAAGLGIKPSAKTTEIYRSILDED